MKQKRVKKPAQTKWFTNELLAEIKARDKCLQTVRKTMLSDDWSQFRRLKNRVTRLIRNAKCSYYKESIMENRKNPQKLWSIIKELNNKNEQTDNLHSINVNGSVITN